MKVVPALLILIIGCLVPIIFGMEMILLANLPGGLPFGTLLASIAIISASIIPVIKSKSGSLLYRMSLVLLLASILWLPLGIYLSGNAALTFVQDAADSIFFWRFTAGLSVSLLIILLWIGGIYLHDRRAE